MATGSNQELNGYLETFEEARDFVIGRFYFYKDSPLSGGVTIDYPQHLIPREGLFSGAEFDLKLSVTPVPNEIAGELTPNMSTKQAIGLLAETDPEGWRFSLSDVDDDSSLGQLWISPEFVPDWLDKDVEECYVTVQLEYRHERTKEDTDSSETDIERRRVQADEKIEKLS